MTEQEAKDRVLKHREWGFCDMTMQALAMAGKALDKQIPKTPNLEGDGYSDGQLVYDTWICPNCGSRYEMDYEEHKHCPNCGHKIRWEKSNE